MKNIKIFNNISEAGLSLLDAEKYSVSKDFEEYDAALVRSAALHDVEFPKSLIAIARAGAGVNNIPLDKCSEQGICVFNTPGANANLYEECQTIAPEGIPLVFHECGSIPTEAQMKTRDTAWLFFMTWHTDYITDKKYNAKGSINTIYNSDYFITLDELPDFTKYKKQK